MPELCEVSAPHHQRLLVLVPPVDPRGPAVRAFARQFTTAVRTGAVHIDETPCRQWSPGQRLWLARLHQIAEGCQRRRS